MTSIDTFCSIPALDLAKPIRQVSTNSAQPGQLCHRSSMTSVSSFPSLHLGNPVRHDSFLSGDFQRQARRDSMISIDTADSIQQDFYDTKPLSQPGNPPRWEPHDSKSSFASLRPAKPIRYESLGSIGSFPPEHHANRQSIDSIETSASLHAGNPIKSEPMISIETITPLYLPKHSIGNTTTSISRPEKIMRQHSNGTINSLIPPLRPGNPIRQTSLGSQSANKSSLRRSFHGRQESSGSLNTILSKRPRSLIRQNSGGSLRQVNQNSLNRHYYPDSVGLNNSFCRVGYPIQSHDSSSSIGSARSSHRRNMLRSRSPARHSLRCRAIDSTASSQNCTVGHFKDVIKEEASKSFSSDAPTESEMCEHAILLIFDIIYL